jgi:cytochrome c oxidase cbb3-type subunit 3
MNARDPKEKLLDHNYDGIQEFDNPLPRWWLATFYGAIVFAFLYLGYYHFGPGATPEETLAHDLGELKALDKASEAKEAGPSEVELAAVFKDLSRREAGKKLFLEKCSSCHGADGGGLIGPNLTDKFWLHGRGTLVDIAEVVSNGVADKGMPTWKLLMKKDEIYSVVAYVKSLKGTHPANPKAPQGTEVKD